jgi:hypothetical protein
VSNQEPEERTRQPVSPEGVATLIAFLDTGAFDRRRYTILSRLRALHDSDQFAALPDDLRQRIREIVADTSR